MMFSECMQVPSGYTGASLLLCTLHASYPGHLCYPSSPLPPDSVLPFLSRSFHAFRQQPQPEWERGAVHEVPAWSMRRNTHRCVLHSMVYISIACAADCAVYLHGVHLHGAFAPSARLSLLHMHLPHVPPCTPMWHA